MRRAALALTCFLMLVVPALLVEGKHVDDPSNNPQNNPSEGQSNGAPNAPTLVTFLDPMVPLPAAVTSLVLVNEKNGNRVRVVPSGEDLPFPTAKHRSLVIGLEWDGTLGDLDTALAPLDQLAKLSEAGAALPRINLVWGSLGSFDVDLKGGVNITHTHIYQHDQTDLEFVVARATPASDPPRNVAFPASGFDGAIWLLDLTIDRAVNWSPHRGAPHADRPQLEFTSAEGRSMNFELMFDTYEERSSVEPAVAWVFNHTLAAPNRPGPVLITFGHHLGFQGILESIGTKYTMFLPDGTPCRATVNIRFTEASRATFGHRDSHHGGGGNFSSVSSVNFTAPEGDMNATMMALTLWHNTTDANGNESVDYLRFATFASRPRQFKSPGPMNLSIDLLFDGYETKTNVSVFIANLEKYLVTPNDPKRPPLVHFTWGHSVTFEGVLESLSLRFTLFLEDGTPCRAVVELTIKEATSAKEQLEHNPRH